MPEFCPFQRYQTLGLKMPASGLKMSAKKKVGKNYIGKNSKKFTFLRFTLSFFGFRPNMFTVEMREIFSCIFLVNQLEKFFMKNPGLV